MTSSFRPSSLIIPAILAAMGTMTVASAQSASPFAKKNKKQAWEIEHPTQPAQSLPTPPPPVNAPPTLPRNYEYGAPNQAQTSRVPTYRAQSIPQSVQPNWQDLQAGPEQAAQDAGLYYPGRRNGGAKPRKPAHNIGSYEAKSQYGTPAAQQNFAQNYAAPNYQQTPYGDPNQPQWGQQAQYQGRAYQNPNYQNPNYQSQSYQGQAYQGQPPYAQQGPVPQPKTAKRSWKDKFGWNNLKTVFRGGATVGAAAVENPNGAGDWNAEFIGDADIEVEVSAITQGGLEYGANLGARAQYDRFRRGFGQRLPDCPPTAAGCSSAVIDGVVTGLRGHTSQFFSDGADDAQAEEIQLESAYVFLRSAYGDVTLGRDDGSAYLFSLGAPSLLKTGASNSPVDYTGFDSVKTVNDASGFAEKVTYTSPRLLGDTVGIGVQFGASYAPNAEGCGVDYCVRSNNDQGSGTIAADLRNVVEVGIALDRNFGNGFKAELTGSYARADERSGFTGLDDLEAFNAGVELTYNDWVLGGSYLHSNNGLLDGDYEAYDVGLTWKPSRLGFTLGYGHATDDNVNLSSDQAVFGVSYDFDTITVGTGVQYIDRSTSAFDGLNVTRQSEDATAIFIQTGFKF